MPTSIILMDEQQQSPSNAWHLVANPWGVHRLRFQSDDLSQADPPALPQADLPTPVSLPVELGTQPVHESVSARPEQATASQDMPDQKTPVQCSSHISHPPDRFHSPKHR